MAIEQHAFEAFFRLVVPAITAGNLKAVDDMLDDEDDEEKRKCRALLVDPYTGNTSSIGSGEVTKDAVCVIQMRGMLYSWESEWVASVVNFCESNDNVSGIVLDIDGPGGMVDKVDQASGAIERCSKPTATVVTGMMASAHFWIGTAADHTFIKSPLCEVGSVGVVITHYGFREYFRKMGIDYQEIYPDTADLKNKETRALNEGDDSIIKNRAERTHEYFSRTVARNLGIAHDPSLPIFRGEMFMAVDAISSGYIDEMGDENDAIRWVFGRSMSSRASSY